MVMDRMRGPVVFDNAQLRRVRTTTPNRETMSADPTNLATDSPAIQSLDPDGAKNLDLPSASDAAGQVFFVTNRADAAEAITVRDENDDTVITVGQDQVGIVWSDGTEWSGLSADAS